MSGVKVASGIDQTMMLSEGRLVSAGGVSIVGGAPQPAGPHTLHPHPIHLPRRCPNRIGHHLHR
ncbi:hypothetical protein, partial [Burkholderia multivorans]|uniref:hypothetical protein n=1 Tax=Burkholderia multivorans TaxID=87883 RepID=UPI001C661480